MANEKQHNQIINDTITLNLSSVIHGGYVRLNRLQDIVYDTYGNSSIAYATNLNVFIDLTSILHPLYSENNRIVYNNITDVSSGIINMCGHYRSFFRSLKVDTKFFLINSLNTCNINRKFVAQYNDIFLRKTEVCATRGMIDNNMSLLKILCPYLPDIYFIDSPDQYETAVIIAHLIETLNDGNPNLIISHDMYPLQLVAYYPYTSYLYPKKHFGEDLSWMIPINEKENFRREFWDKVSLIRKIRRETLEEMSPLNYALYTAMTYCPERNVNRLLTSIQAKNIITKLVGNDDIKVDPIQLTTNPEFANFYPSDIIARYNAIDVTYALAYYRNTPEARNIKLLDLDDVPTVNRIAAKYYANNPLDLNKL